MAVDSLHRPCSVDGVRCEHVSLQPMTRTSGFADSERMVNLVDVPVVFKAQSTMGMTRWTRQSQYTARKSVPKVGYSRVVLDKCKL